jgi:hypothetical protein
LFWILRVIAREHADVPKILSTRRKSREMKTWMEFRGTLEILFATGHVGGALGDAVDKGALRGNV